MYTLYVLRLAGKKYYCGKTSKDVHARFMEHKRGHGAEWTRLHKPVELVHSKASNSPFDEDNLVKEWMIKHGIANVRGGSYSQTVLSTSQASVLRSELRSAKDACFHCGSSDHFVKNCPEMQSSSSDCSLSEQEEPEYESYLDSVQCWKCKNFGHYANECDNSHIRCYICDNHGHYATECTERYY